MSLGSAEPLDREYLRASGAWRTAWRPRSSRTTSAGPASAATTATTCSRCPSPRRPCGRPPAKIRDAQDALGRRILLENISSYLEHAGAELTEADFLYAVVEEADCGILLDVNNLYVNARNHGIDPLRYLDRLPAGRVGQMHLAGHEDHGDVVIDTHDHPVADAVWTLYQAALLRLGPVPTLIEWDAKIPAFDVVLAEARRAEAVLAAVSEPPRRVQRERAAA